MNRKTEISALARRSRPSLVHLCGLLLFVTTSYSDLPALAQDMAQGQLNGTWKAQGKELWLKIEDDRIITLHDDQAQVHSLLTATSDTLEVLTSGHREIWPYSLSDGSLQLTKASDPYQLARVAEGPPALGLQPASIGAKQPLPPERVATIVQELADRMERDQKLRKDNDKPSKLEETVEDNTSYLVSLVREIGWIDVERFGVGAAFDAAILAKHSRDLSLMTAALPLIEQDFASPGEHSQAFAVLFDGVQIRLGKRQRYGTQIGWIEGKPFVLALEDRDKVDRYRADLGLPPLKKYLETAQQYLGEQIGILPY